ncbi:MAG: prepilin peptidase [Novosphingobium sp.]
MMPFAGVALLIGLCLVASWSDIAQRRLPNWLSAATLASGLAAALLTGGTGALGWHGLHVVVALAAGMGLYALGVIGAGDAKFYAAVAAWFPFQDGLRLFVGTTMAGFILLLVWAAVRRARGEKVFSGNRKAEAGLPYGVAISCGAILLALQ